MHSASTPVSRGQAELTWPGYHALHQHVGATALPGPKISHSLFLYVGFFAVRKRDGNIYMPKYTCMATFTQSCSEPVSTPRQRIRPKRQPPPVQFVLVLHPLLGHLPSSMTEAGRSFFILASTVSHDVQATELVLVHMIPGFG